MSDISGGHEGSDVLNPASMQSRSVLAHNMRARRTALGLSQAGLARKAGLDCGHVGALERAMHSASVDTLEALSKALGVGPCDLLTAPAGFRPGEPEIDVR
jgi:transcriptional regulator with XRE-family HTH domain